MTTTTSPTAVAHPEEQQEEAFVGKVFETILGAQLAQTATIGSKLGWYKALAKADDATGLTAFELANFQHDPDHPTPPMSVRYACEWLEQQATAGWIHCPNPTDGAEKRRFMLPKAHANVLANPDSENYLLPLAVLTSGTAKVMDQLVEAYKKDTGVNWKDLGDDGRQPVADVNRPFYMQSLGGILESALDEATIDKLKHRGGRVADIGAGYAWSSIGIAQHFSSDQNDKNNNKNAPGCRIDAYDLDQPSIDAAIENIASHGLSDRIKAHCMDAALALKSEDFEPCDLVVALECVHDMSDPISVLRTMRNLAGGAHGGDAPTGTIIIMDEKVADSFAAGIGSPIEQAAYGFSCLCCLADGKSHGQHSAETGAVMRPSILRMYAQQAGFREVEILDAENDFYRFYKLVG